MSKKAQGLDYLEHLEQENKIYVAEKEKDRRRWTEKGDWSR